MNWNSIIEIDEQFMQLQLNYSIAKLFQFEIQFQITIEKL